jgi:hypothetical protein
VSEWYDNCKGSFNAAKRNNWMDECCAHMLTRIKHAKKTVWGEKLILDTLDLDLDYTTWCKENNLAYRAASRLKLLPKIREMLNCKVPRDLTYEKCLSTTEGYDNISSWKKDHESEYKKARSNGWINDLKKERGWSIIVRKHPYGYWTEERIREDVDKKDYRTVNIWMDEGEGSYYAARRLGIRDELVKLIKERRNKNK